MYTYLKFLLGVFLIFIYNKFNKLFYAGGNVQPFWILSGNSCVIQKIGTFLFTLNNWFKYIAWSFLFSTPSYSYFVN